MAEAQRLIDAIEPGTLASLRDRAILGIMGYAWASLDAVLRMQVRDYYPLGQQRWVRFIDRGAERHEIVDRRLEPLLEAYVTVAGIGSEPHAPLFRSILPGQRVSSRSVNHSTIVSLIRNFETGVANHPAHRKKKGRSLTDAELHRMIESIDSQHITALRDRAILGMFLYANASVLDIIGLKAQNFYKWRDEYWIRLPAQAPIKADLGLVTLMREYGTAIRPRRSPEAFLFGRDRVRPLAHSDVRAILERYGDAKGAEA